MKKTLLMILSLSLLQGCSSAEKETPKDNPDNQQEVEIQDSPADDMDLEPDSAADTEDEEEKEAVLPADLPVSSFDTREVRFSIGDQQIYGSLFVPDNGLEKHPLVISSHGLGGSYLSTLDTGKILASRGYAFLSFDFRGGFFSDGSILEMSVMTEVEDLETILFEVAGWDFVDSIILYGESQGGLVSSIVAARYPEMIRAMVLNYPAYNIPTIVHSLFDTLDEVPAEFDLEWLQVGYPYVADIWDYSPFDEIGNYDGPVLILHGTSDSVVPLIWSQQAEQIYPDARLIILNGAGHGFKGIYFDEATDDILAFLAEVDPSI